MTGSPHRQEALRQGDIACGVACALGVCGVLNVRRTVVEVRDHADVQVWHVGVRVRVRVRVRVKRLGLGLGC